MIESIYYYVGGEVKLLIENLIVEPAFMTVEGFIFVIVTSWVAIEPSQFKEISMFADIPVHDNTPDIGIWLLSRSLAHCNDDGNYTLILLYGGKSLVVVISMIILDSVLTVDGSNVIVADWSSSGTRVTVDEWSVAE